MSKFNPTTDTASEAQAAGEAERARDCGTDGLPATVTRSAQPVHWNDLVDSAVERHRTKPPGGLLPSRRPSCRRLERRVAELEAEHGLRKEARHGQPDAAERGDDASAGGLCE